MFRLPKIVLERLRRKALAPEVSGGPSPAPGLAASPHPDANLLAAFVERSLTERERGQVLNHLAQCAVCRELVELISPAEAAPAWPEHPPARSGWRAWPLLRWSALAAALAAVAVAVVWHPAPWRKQPVAARLASQQSEQKLLATAAPPTPPAAHEMEKTAERASGAAKPSAPPPAPSHRRPAAQAKGISRTESQAELYTAGTAPEARSISSDLVAAPAANAPQPSAAPSPPRVATTAVRTGAVGARAPSMAFRARLAGAPAPRGALWTISADGKVQRSADHGATWQDVLVDDQVTFRVLQATGQDVWVGGSGGALYHSSDGGLTWSRAPLSADGASSTDAIVAIITSTGRPERLTIQTASGDQWTTEDNGQHWQRETPLLR
jgi:hypothetical protein